MNRGPTPGSRRRTRTPPSRHTRTPRSGQEDLQCPRASVLLRPGRKRLFPVRSLRSARVPASRPASGFRPPIAARGAAILGGPKTGSGWSPADRRAWATAGEKPLPPLICRACGRRSQFVRPASSPSCANGAIGRPGPDRGVRVCRPGARGGVPPRPPAGGPASAGGCPRPPRYPRSRAQHAR